MEWDKFITDFFYYACDGSPTDMKTLEQGKWLDMLLVFDNYIAKTEAFREQYDKLKNKHGWE